jgi:hypothetical protein
MKKWQKIITSMQKYCRKRKRYIWGVLVCLLLYDLYSGWSLYCIATSGSKDNYFVFKRLCDYYCSINLSYEQCDMKKKKYVLRYIPNWQSFFTRQASYFSYLWHDRDYIIPAPASINFIRKLLFKREAAYLLFNMNDAPVIIQQSPNTIIIAEPYAQKGERLVFTVENLKSGVGSLMNEKDFQKQLRLQDWKPKINKPPESIVIPDWEGAFQYDLNLVDGLFEKKLPLRNLKNNLYR